MDVMRGRGREGGHTQGKGYNEREGEGEGGCHDNGRVLEMLMWRFNPTHRRFHEYLTSALFYRT